MRDSKKAQKVITFRYKHVRSALFKSFTPNGFSADVLLERVNQIDTILGQTEWERNDLKLSSRATKLLAELAPQFELKNAERIKFSRKSAKLEIAGVKVSIQPVMLFRLQDKGVIKLGGIILYTTQAKAQSLSRDLDGNCAGHYVATLFLRLLNEVFSHEGTPFPARCYCVDVWRKQIYLPPSKQVTLNKHINAGCETVKNLWTTIIF